MPVVCFKLYYFYIIIQLCVTSNKFGEDVMLTWNFEHSVEQYSAVGGTSEGSVKQQIEQLRTALLLLV